MNVFTSWSGGRFDLVGYLKRLMLVVSTMVKMALNVWSETLLKKLKSRWK